MERKEKLVNNEVYHVYTKSIAGFVIFNNPDDFSHLKNIVKYYQKKDMPIPFSAFLRSEETKKGCFGSAFANSASGKDNIVSIVAYCFMPTHIHFILKQLRDNGISSFAGNILNSYSHHFNLKHKRKGPLWEGKFKNVLVKTDEQLLHLSRYIHLNPTSAGIVNSPEKWPHSSYHEYLGNVGSIEKICCFDDVLTISSDYKKFVEDRIDYQKKLALIKHLVLE